MEKHYTLTEIKKELKEDYPNAVLKIEVSPETTANGEQIIDINLNAYSLKTGNCYDGETLETYKISEMKKVLKRIEKLENTYEIINYLD